MRGFRRSNGYDPSKYIPLILTLILYCCPQHISSRLYEICAGFVWKLRLSSMETVHLLDSAHKIESQNDQYILKSEESHLVDWQSQEMTAQKIEKEASLDAVVHTESVIKLPFTPFIGSVIYQESPPYGTALWINIGKKNSPSEKLSTSGASPESTFFKLEKNCPVLCQGTLIGCIDFVGDYTSRVILVSDPKVAISTRVRRSLIAKTHSKAMKTGLNFQKAIQEHAIAIGQSTSQQYEKALKAINTIILLLKKNQKESFQTEGAIYLAKGQLRGSKSKEKPIMLDGVGFTCEFEDSYSPKRDLRTGQSHPNDERIAIIKPGDILETAGLDGIFPRGLPIARIKEVLPLVEGATSYTIKATPLLDLFPIFEYLTVLPKLPLEVDKMPTQVERILTLLEEETTPIQNLHD